MKHSYFGEYFTDRGFQGAPAMWATQIAISKMATMKTHSPRLLSGNWQLLTLKSIQISWKSWKDCRGRRKAAHKGQQEGFGEDSTVTAVLHVPAWVWLVSEQPCLPHTTVVMMAGCRPTPPPPSTIKAVIFWPIWGQRRMRWEHRADGNARAWWAMALDGAAPCVDPTQGLPILSIAPAPHAWHSPAPRQLGPCEPLGMAPTCHCRDWLHQASLASNPPFFKKKINMSTVSLQIAATLLLCLEWFPTLSLFPLWGTKYVDLFTKLSIFKNTEKNAKMHWQVSWCGAAQRFRDLVQGKRAHTCTHANTHARVRVTRAGLESCLSHLYSQAWGDNVPIHTQPPVLMYR